MDVAPPTPDTTDATAEKIDDPDDWAGTQLRSTLKLLAIPGVLALLILLLGISLPSWGLYGIGAVFAIVLVPRMWREPELLLAIVTMYLPLNKLFVLPLGPGLNGTNILEVVLVASAIVHGRSSDSAEAPDGVPKHDAVRPPSSRLMATYCVWSLLSVVTAVFVAGLDYVIDKLGDLRQWIDQFIVFFAFSRLIKDGKMARRMLVYMMVAASIVLALGFQEWLEKRDASSIEKARLLGPQMQPNDFGAYMSYAAAPFIALLLNNIRRPRILAITLPYLLATARVLLATFSRGAYLGMALAALVAGYVRGKRFIIGSLLAAVLLVAVFPQIVPESLRARMGQTTSTDASGREKLDTSAETRLILWNAAWKMTLKSPIFGYGFKTFPKFKGEYTETEVMESDNHNMYFWLSSQMGIPAVVLLLMIMWRMGSLGMRVYRGSEDMFSRVVGMTATGLAAGAFLVNMFGSRMVDICVTVNFWITLAVVSRLWMDVETRRIAALPR